MLSLLGVKISLLEKGKEKFTSSKLTSQIRKFELSGEYKNALRLIKRFYISSGQMNGDFIKECDKLLFKPVELTKEEYEAFKKNLIYREILTDTEEYDTLRQTGGLYEIRKSCNSTDDCHFYI